MNAEHAKPAEHERSFDSGSVRLQPDLSTTINAQTAEFAESSVATTERLEILRPLSRWIASPVCQTWSRTTTFWIPPFASLLPSTFSTVVPSDLPTFPLLPAKVESGLVVAECEANSTGSRIVFALTRPGRVAHFGPLGR